MKKLFLLAVCLFWAWKVGAAPDKVSAFINVTGPNELSDRVGTFINVDYGGTITIDDIESLTITGGPLDANNDLSFLSGMTHLVILDLHEAFLEDNNLLGTAFSPSNDIKELHIPDGVISAGAFAECGKLKDIYFYSATPPVLSGNPFSSSVLSEIKIHVPLGASDAYAAGTGWSAFADKIEETGWGNIFVTLKDGEETYAGPEGAQVRCYLIQEGKAPVVYEAEKMCYEGEGCTYEAQRLLPGEYIVSVENLPAGYLTTYYAAPESGSTDPSWGVTRWSEADKVEIVYDGLWYGVWINELPLKKPEAQLSSGTITIDGYVYYNGKQKARVARNASVGIYYSKKGSGASKRFEPDPNEWTLIRTVQPDENAYYIVQNLPAGRYLIVADIPGYDLTGGYTLEAEEGETIHDNNFFVNDYAQVITISDNPTSAPAQESETFRLYPNPFKGALQLAGAAGSTLTVTTPAGATVHTQKVTRAEETVHLEHLPAGLYLLLLDKDGKRQTKKIVKSE
ncbi:MAG: leucine-rich repeat domain-containing protein [Bacteroidales bacterium]|jgi:hypothetical protein|nr:leucine-rich repeat domain-containing protein [Bacteroidales bacterium]